MHTGEMSISAGNCFFDGSELPLSQGTIMSTRATEATTDSKTLPHGTCVHGLVLWPSMMPTGAPRTSREQLHSQRRKGFHGTRCEEAQVASDCCRHSQRHILRLSLLMGQQQPVS